MFYPPVRIMLHRAKSYTSACRDCIADIGSLSVAVILGQNYAMMQTKPVSQLFESTKSKCKFADEYLTQRDFFNLLSKLFDAKMVPQGMKIYSALSSMLSEVMLQSFAFDRELVREFVNAHVHDYYMQQAWCAAIRNIEQDLEIVENALIVHLPRDLSKLVLEYLDHRKSFVGVHHTHRAYRSK